MYGRSSYGRQNRGQSFAPSTRPFYPSEDPRILDGLHPYPIKELQHPLAAETKEYQNVEPREVTPVASYNWTNDEQPTILVPGCPPIWQNKPTPFKLDRDTGVSFIDQNRHRIPQYPALPMYYAIDTLSANFDFPSIDIATDRNNLRKLIRWIEGTSKGDFRIDLQLSGTTAIFTRYETVKVEMDSGRLGFGRNFEQYMTKRLAGCENSTGHSRIITYRYGDLKLLVGFEVDACVYYDKETEERKDMPADMRTIPGDDPDDLLATLRKMSICSDGEIKVVSHGVMVPQSSLIEMSTKSERYFAEGIDWQERFPQLFISQTPQHYLGVHVSGQFRRIEAHTLNDTVLSAQQRKQQPSFDKLHVLLKKIKELVVAHGEDARLSLVYRVKTGKLEVFSRESKASALPDKWMARFNVPASQTQEQNTASKEKASALASADTSGDSDASRLVAAASDESGDAERFDESDGDSD